MKITIAEAVNLKSQLEKKVNELDAERNKVATDTIDKGEKGDIPARNVDVITAEIEKVENDLLDLKAAIREVNRVTYIEWDNRQYPLNNALDIAKVIRNRADRAKKLGNRKKLERNTSRGLYGNGDSNTFTVALYDPEQYKADGQKQERLANKLSALIEKANHIAEFNFPAAGEYLA